MSSRRVGLILRCKLLESGKYTGKTAPNPTSGAKIIYLTHVASTSFGMFTRRLPTSDCNVESALPARRRAENHFRLLCDLVLCSIDEKE